MYISLAVQLNYLIYSKVFRFECWLLLTFKTISDVTWNRVIARTKTKWHLIQLTGAKRIVSEVLSHFSLLTASVKRVDFFMIYGGSNHKPHEKAI